MKKSKREDKAGKAAGKPKTKLSRKAYEAELFKLHAELVKLQYWVKEKGLRIIVVFEGRDAGPGRAVSSSVLRSG
jgi:polyphosphate kinase 2 (PPK2 family)